MVKPARLSRILLVMASVSVPWDGSTVRAAPDERGDLTDAPIARALTEFLASAQDPATGLLESFPRSADPLLDHIGFTYDEAVSSLVLAHAGRSRQAEHILAVFIEMPLPAPGMYQFNTAYHIQQERPALEYRVHAGPLCWVAIGLMRYGEQADDRAARDKGIALVEWAQRHLHHVNGGVAMGIEGPWDSLLSVENDWVYYAALRIAIQQLPDGPRRQSLIYEKRSVREWLSAHQRDRGGNGDTTKALDVYTHALLVGPESHLEDTEVDPAALARWAKAWIAELDELFRVPGTARYDYTDAGEAARMGRLRIGWLEGTEQVVVAYLTWAPFFDAHGDHAFAEQLRAQASRSHAEVLAQAMLHGGVLAVPNTDAPAPCQTFRDGWVARPRSEPALNGTNWAYLAEVGYNPFTTSLLPQDSRRFLARSVE